MNAEPADVADFLVRLASRPRSPKATTRPGEPLAPGSIRICLAAINRKFRERDIDSPAHHPRVAAVLQALRRRSAGPGRQVRALREHEVARILEHCDLLARREPYHLIAARDAALIAVGFAGALRRSEIRGLRIGDVEFLGGPEETDGMYVNIRRSKTDQFGTGQRIAIPDGKLIRPVSRLHAWLTLSGIDEGPVFQTMRRGGRLQGRALGRSDVPRLVKRYVGSIGLDPAEYSGHSLRAGFVTSAAAHHARLDKIMEVTRHKSTDMVLRYIRQADAFEDHAGAGFL
ncbi:MAG: site-specific integrase [Holophagales bacterium]|nr:site-specific integrase [Holophagales bacterium]MYH26788.1 site-specific integrase [Holophagales bacterium]